MLGKKKKKGRNKHHDMEQPSDVADDQDAADGQPQHGMDDAADAVSHVLLHGAIVKLRLTRCRGEQVGGDAGHKEGATPTHGEGLTLEQAITGVRPRGEELMKKADPRIIFWTLVSLVSNWELLYHLACAWAAVMQHTYWCACMRDFVLTGARWLQMWLSLSSATRSTRSSSVSTSLISVWLIMCFYCRIARQHSRAFLLVDVAVLLCARFTSVPVCLRHEALRVCWP